jgi:bifunctional DNA-binding transcriptional regulator/antitoxin component of YhaV-PrlF toxin-antitoxin module
MNELFRLKIASKRQMTAPQRLLDVLGLNEGDEIQIEIAEGQIVDVHPCKAVPTRMLTEELLSKIKEREERMLQGYGLTPEEALREAKARRVKLTNTMDSRATDIEKKLAR